MENDYDKFFYTYEAVEPPKYTKINLDKLLKKENNNFSNPYFKDPTTKNYSPVINYIFTLNNYEGEQELESGEIQNIISPDFSNSSNLSRSSNYYNDIMNVLVNDEDKSVIASNIYNALKTELDWDDLKISALLGNAMLESGFDLGALNEKSSAHGLFLFLSDTTNAFSKWDNKHPEYKEKYPDEYVRQALWIATSLDNRDSSVIMDEEGQDDQSWEDWESNDLNRMSKALKRMFFRSGSSDNSYYQRSEYSRAVYDITQGRK